MGSQKLEVLWSPSQEDQYITYGTEIKLYKVEKFTPSTFPKDTGIWLGEDTGATLLAKNNDTSLLKYMQCLSWCPKSDPDNLLSVAQTNGRVSLVSFGQAGRHHLIGKEFSPKYPRQCNYLAWNPVDSHLLAQGLEKARNDPCVLIWDVNAKQGTEFSSGSERQRLSSLTDSRAINKPIVEIGAGDGSASFCWCTDKTFICSVGKTVRKYDLRDMSKPTFSIKNPYVSVGLCVEPLSGIHLASYQLDGANNPVLVWDLRNFDRPILTLSEMKPVQKIKWCPTRKDLLAVLLRESQVIRLYDMHHSTTGADDLEPSIMDRTIQTHSNQTITSFSWHPKHENRLLAVTSNGAVHDLTVMERIALTWSPKQSLLWVTGKKSVDWTYDEDDISIKMRKRASDGYGMTRSDVFENAAFVDGDLQVQSLWNWLGYVNHLQELKLSVKVNNERFVGVRTVLGLDNPESRLKSDFLFTYMDGLKGANRLSRKVYSSEERNHALQLCCWGETESFLSHIQERVSPPPSAGSIPKALKHLSKLQKEGKYERDAAVAVFNLKMKLAIEILSAGGKVNPSLNTVAMALAGCTDEKSTLWNQVCNGLKQQMTNPYIRALFSFLTMDRENYEGVLNEEGVSVRDKVAFACKYLSDLKLKEYLNDLTNRLKSTGNLEGIVLTGMTHEGCDLLENFVDITGDVQTVSLTAIHTFPSGIAKDTRVQNWIECYRSLLDQWCFWHERAKFDILWHSQDNVSKIPSQVFVSCNFCGKSVACNIPMAVRTRPYMSKYMGGPHKPKVTCCPGCRKPLPRCALCLTNLGTASGTALHNQRDAFDRNAILTSFNDWFTWCQTCRHGGHAEHITEWFREHTECPVTACTCHCALQDSIGRKSAASQALTIKVP